MRDKKDIKEIREIRDMGVRDVGEGKALSGEMGCK